jgi:pimeloyl-ACP methyl ester carboxylesterase
MSSLDVPGARLFYDIRGEGPLLLLIGSPMDSGPFLPLADIMAADHTVVTYDPRGFAKSTRDDPDQDITPELQADDVLRLIEAAGGGPVDFLGSSGGATVGLALVQAHPEVVRTLVAHEPPVVELLPDRDEQRARIQQIYETYLAHGGMAAMQQFLKWTGLGGMGGGDDAPRWEPTPEQLSQMDAANTVFYGHLLRQTTAFRPDIEALRAAPTRIVVGVGEMSVGQLPRATGEALAAELGLPVVEFPGDHGGFLSHAADFAAALRKELAA